MSDLTARAAAGLMLFTLGCGDRVTDLPDASRDRIVFSAASGSYDIYVMDQDGGNRVQLTASPVVEELEPAPSPDGTRIAFASGPDINVMNADGSGNIQLTGLPERFPGEAGRPSWSPDGQKILFTGYSDQPGDIYVMNADGGGRVRLTNDPGQEDFGAWAPNGQRIAFVRWHGVPPRPHIFVMDADGGNIRQLTSGDFHDFWPAWSPDSRQIVFVRATEGGATRQIFMMTAAGTGLRRLTDGQRLDGEPSWSRDGKKLLFNSRRDEFSGHADIWVSRADGTQGVNLNKTPTIFEGYARWLPVP